MANSKITWSNQRRKLSELIPWERNPRQITDKQAKRLEESFEQFGQVEISPAYVAVAIQRWVDVTGGTPELVD